MEFPIYTPWENLDAQTIQKVINSGINYRIYCDEKPWDVSFEIDFLPKEELIMRKLTDMKRGMHCSQDLRQDCLEIMYMNHTWITCIPGNTGVIEYFCQIIMKNNYIRCSQIPMLL